MSYIKFKINFAKGWQDYPLLQMEQIKRANRMYTNDSIFLKKSLSIPVMSDSDQCVNGVDLNLEDSEEDNAGRGSAQNGHTERSSEEKRDDGSDIVSDLTPVDFLKRLDGLISQSKQAAVKGCQDAERRYVCLPVTARLFTLLVQTQSCSVFVVRQGPQVLPS